MENPRRLSADLLCFHRLCAKPTCSTAAPIAPERSSNYTLFFWEICTQSGPCSLPILVGLFSNKPPPFHLQAKVGRLRDELVVNAQDRDMIAKLSEEQGDFVAQQTHKWGFFYEALRSVLFVAGLSPRGVCTLHSWAGSALLRWFSIGEGSNQIAAFP